MDFGTLLHKAQKNEVTKKEPIRYYSTKFEPPKKEQRNKNQLAINVRKFLEKKEQEEKQKRIEAQKKKEELLSLRSKDKKAVKRVSVMLKRTKSANQSVIEDAVDSDNTAVTLAGPAQPDEDDYGYVSQEASAFYNKMMDKYNKMPEEPSRFSLEKKKVSTNLTSTKDRVKAALEKEKEEAMMPHKRKRKHAHAEDGNSSREKFEEVEEEKVEEKKPKVEKPKPKAPPPMNFAELLKLAEKKQFEPIVVEKKPKEEENPLTKKQKREMERVREWQDRKNDKNRPLPNHKPVPNNNDKINEKAPKAGSSSKLAEALTKDKPKPTSSSGSKSEKRPDEPEPEVPRKKIDWGPKHPGANRMNNTANLPSSLKKNTSSISKPPEHPHKSKTEQPVSNYQKSSSNRSQNEVSRQPSNTSNDSRKTNQFPVSKDLKNDRLKAQKENKIYEGERRQMSSQRPKEFPPRDLMKSKGLPPKQFPPADLRPKKFPPADVRSAPNKMKINKGRIMDDDDEEDSEMDDFIDDGPEEEEDYSKYISEIFGYNKRKYADFDDDDIEEASFAQQMKEEVISTKLGIMEDLEDMRLEEEHKKRKALMKKKVSKRK